jgi:aminopeptidase N
MRFLKVTLIALLICTATFAQKIETGVSLELATVRSKLISNIQYRLDFNIPANKEEDIPSLLHLEFDLSQIPEVLQLDFKEDKSKLKSIWVNGQETVITFENEHILLAGKNLKNGRNNIKITFIAGNGSLNRNKEYLYALFVPANARTAFPCFDQPDLKARFELSLTVPTGWKVLANGQLKDSTVLANSVKYQFNNSDKISTYLFSFTIGKFDQAKRLDNQGMELLYRENDPVKIKFSVDSIFKLHMHSLNFLTKWTGIPYPFQKIGFAAIPDFQFGGMEHPGAVLYKASSLFLDDAAIKDQHISRANLIAHETAHMWFGDLVTMKWFNDVWMKEVFANFMADKMAGQGFELKFLQDHFPAAYGVDRTLGANPIRQQLDNLQDAGSMYGNIIYHKAPIMMRQLEALMGEANFQKGIQEYLAQYANKNATWPDLITILSKHTTADLYAWNKVWVNLPGRPIFSYDVAYQGNKIKNFTINQHPEFGEQRFWPQVFTLKLVYPRRTKIVTVNMKDANVGLVSLIGVEKPLYYLFNANSMGYGLFPVDKAMLGSINLLSEPVERASVYINLYENTLAGNFLKPKEAINLYVNMLGHEKNELNLRLITNYVSNLYWNFLKEDDRNALHQELENSLWTSMSEQSEANCKKILFNTYQNVYLSDQAAKRMLEIWENKTPPDGIKLSEDDYIAIAVSIALRAKTPTPIITYQIDRTINNDRKERLNFLAPALAADSQTRTNFFNSLKAITNRKKEAWVLTGLSYLHHPLRQQQSQKHLQESLLLLEEIKQTGDIFFPQSWLAATFGAYQSAAAYQVVQDFLKANPNYNPMLKDKILQATDNLRRAQNLLPR